MGEYNDTIRDFSKIKQKLLDALELYRDGAVKGCDLLASQIPTCYTDDIKTFRRNFKEWFEECCEEVNSFLIRSNGEVCYKNKIYTGKSAVKAVITLHRKGMAFPFLIDASKKLSDYVEEYFAFLDDFATTVRDK